MEGLGAKKIMDNCSWIIKFLLIMDVFQVTFIYIKQQNAIENQSTSLYKIFINELSLSLIIIFSFVFITIDQTKASNFYFYIKTCFFALIWSIVINTKENFIVVCEHLLTACLHLALFQVWLLKFTNDIHGHYHVKEHQLFYMFLNVYFASELKENKTCQVIWLIYHFQIYVEKRFLNFHSCTIS